MKLEPLPRANYLNQCPWCSARIRWDGDEREESLCPHCSKPIVLTIDRYDGGTIISAERSDTDLRYMEQMGIKEK